MKVYNGIQSVADRVLGDYQSKGFRLVPDTDSHKLTLYYQDEIVPIQDATIKAVREACEKRLAAEEQDVQLCCRECKGRGWLYLKGSECIYLCTIKEHNPGPKVKPCPYVYPHSGHPFS